MWKNSNCCPKDDKYCCRQFDLCHNKINDRTPSAASNCTATAIADSVSAKAAAFSACLISVNEDS